MADSNARTSGLFHPSGSLAEDGALVRVTPAKAGWRYTGLDVIRLRPGERRPVETRSRELLVLPLTGECTVQVGDASFPLAGRRDVFSGVSDFVYVPVGSEVTVSSRRGGEFALPWSVAERPGPVAYVAATDIAVETRGSGRATRQINNLFTAGRSAAHRLVVVEVLTPPGNWSSYPPHKHDDPSSGTEDEMEEIYYFRIQGEHGYGIHRTYTADATIDETVTVREGDVFLVPRGYHGPCAAPPEFAMYYLNVLAGPGAGRTMRFSDDPRYAWIRGTWAEQELDPRVPFATARPDGEAA
jgi:5-deoxy-glucuronate isomerase